MSTSSLRQTLAEHADDIHDTGVAERLASVHHRIGAARRRRRGTAVAAVAIALVAAAGVTAVPLLGGTPQPAVQPRPPKLAGWTIPATETVGTTPYRFHDSRSSQPGERTLTWDLAASDKTRALAWASSPGTWGTSVLKVDGTVLGRTDGAGLTEGLLLTPDAEHRITVSLGRPGDDDQLGLAVYEMVGEPPAGVSNGVATFRQDIAGDRLLAAAIGDPGQKTVEIEATVPSQRLRISEFCYGAGRGLMANVAVDGHPLSGSECQPGPDADPGPSGALFDEGDANLADWGIQAGDSVRLTVTLRPNGNANAGGGDASGAVIGVGIYALGPSAGHVAGWDIPQLTEGVNGRLWEYAGSRVSEPGAGEVVWRLPAVDYPRLVSFASSRIRGGSVQLVVDGERGSFFSAGGGAGDGRELAPGRAHVVKLVHRGSSDSPRSLLGLVLRRPAQ